MTIKTRTELVAERPPITLRAEGAGYDPVRGPVDYDYLADVAHTTCAEVDGYARSGVYADSTTALVTSEGAEAAADSLVLYDLDMTTGDVELCGVSANIAAENDHVIVGTGATKSMSLAGAAPVVLSAAGKTYQIVVIVVNDDGALDWRAIVGAEASDGAEAVPTDTQIQAALRAAKAAGGENADILTDRWLEIGRIKYQRVAGTPNTITTTHTAPGSTIAVRARRRHAVVRGVGA